MTLKNNKNSDKQYDFTVRFSNKWNISFLSLFWLIEISIIIIAINPKYRLVGIIYGLPWLIISIFATMSGIMQFIQVKGTHFYVRTLTGKKYSFNCSEIYNVSCEKQISYKHGPTFKIKIIAKEKTLLVVDTEENFVELARYILVQYENKEIPLTAVSSLARKELMRYATGEIFSPKKRKKYCDWKIKN